jgi:pimeloyl-ACP methyl ester carboxylesterase
LNQQALTVARRRWTVTREVLAFTASVLLFPLGLKKSRKKTPRAADQRTVVFIHGYLANRSSFLPLAGYLAAKGYRSQLSFEYRPGDSIEQAAIKLKQFLKHHVRGGRIDFVCHSLGGLVARVYLQQLGGARRVDRCITIATPHQGTYNAYWLWTRVAQDLRPQSELLLRLAASTEKAARVKFLAIGGGADRIVLPPHHAQFVERNLHFPDMGHQGLLFSRSVFRQISQHLAG